MHGSTIGYDNHRTVCRIVVFKRGCENVVASPPGTQVKLGRFVVPTRKPMIARFLPALPLSLTLARFQVLWGRCFGQASAAVVSGENYAKANSELTNE